MSADSATVPEFSSSRENLIPEVYILWHPSCPIGERLAREIHGWLRPGNGLGPQVFYRSLPAPDAPPDGLPLPLPFETRYVSAATMKARGNANLQIVLALIDEWMVVSPTWRHWLESLATSNANSQIDRHFIPIALDSTAYNVPAAIRRWNFLRPTRHAKDLSQVSPEEKAATDNFSRSLLKQVTEAMCRLLLSRRTQTIGSGSPPATAREDFGVKVRIFLSHAKADGTGPARRIRDYIYSKTQLAAFFDENDIPLSSPFAEVLEQAVRATETAALIAVRTARYARRPWCRRELSLFRRPILEPPSTAAGAVAPEHWRLNPVLVVEAMEGGTISPGIPEFGNVTSIRWGTDVPDQEESVVTTLLRDAMLAEFHAAQGHTIGISGHAVVLNWLPDPITLMHIERIRSQQDLKVYYPGRGLSGLELDILGDYFPNVEFHSFEEIML